MKMYRSLVFRELRLTRKRYALMFILFVLLAAMFALPAFRDDIFFDDTTEAEKYIIVTLFTIIPAAIGSFIAGSNNGVHKSDINTGWKRYSFTLPATPVQKAGADLIVKLIVFVLFGIVAIAQVLLYGALGFGRTAAHTVNVFLAAGAVSLLFDTVYCGIIMLAKDKDELKLYVIFAAAAGLGLLTIIDKLTPSGGFSEDGAKNEMILKNFADFVGSGSFTVIAAGAFIVMCAVYFIVMRKVHGRREP